MKHEKTIGDSTNDLDEIIYEFGDIVEEMESNER